MILDLKQFQFLLENYQEKLTQRGVSQDIIDYIGSIDDRSERGKAISKVMSNPKLTLKDIEVKKDPVELFSRLYPSQWNAVDAADPTPNNDYFRTVLKWWIGRDILDDGTLSMSGNQWIRLPEDESRVQEVLEYYNQNKSKFKTKMISKYKKFQDLEQEYLDVSGKRSKRQEIRDMKMKGAKKILDNSDWRVYMITSKEAACYYGKGTQWCTAATDSHNYADHYIQNTGALYIFIDKETDEKYQSDGHFDDFMDETDRTIDTQLRLDLTAMMYIENDNEYAYSSLNNEQFTYLDEMSEDIYYDLIFKLANDPSTVSASYSLPGTIGLLNDMFIRTFRKSHIKKVEKRLEPLIKDKAGTAYVWAELTKRRFIAAEPTILKAGEKNPRKLMTYAETIIKGRWIEAEAIIRKHKGVWSEYVFSFKESFGKEEFYNNIETGDVIAAIKQSYSKDINATELVNAFLDPKYVNKYVFEPMFSSIYTNRSARDIISFVEKSKIEMDFFKLAIKWMEKETTIFNSESNIDKLSFLSDKLFGSNMPDIQEYYKFIAYAAEPITHVKGVDTNLSIIFNSGRKKRSQYFEKTLLNGPSPKTSTFYTQVVIPYCQKFNYKLSSSERKNVEKNANMNEERWRRFFAIYGVEILKSKYPNDSIHTELLRTPVGGVRLSRPEEIYQHKFG